MAGSRKCQPEVGKGPVPNNDIFACRVVEPGYGATSASGMGGLAKFPVRDPGEFSDSSQENSTAGP